MVFVEIIKCGQRTRCSAEYFYVDAGGGFELSRLTRLHPVSEFESLLCHLRSGRGENSTLHSPNIWEGLEDEEDDTGVLIWSIWR